MNQKNLKLFPLGIFVHCIKWSSELRDKKRLRLIFIL